MSKAITIQIPAVTEQEFQSCIHYYAGALYDDMVRLYTRSGVTVEQPRVNTTFQNNHAIILSNGTPWGKFVWKKTVS
jgi:hypothetical protein